MKKALKIALIVAAAIIVICVVSALIGGDQFWNWLKG